MHNYVQKTLHIILVMSNIAISPGYAVKLSMQLMCRCLQCGVGNHRVWIRVQVRVRVRVRVRVGFRVRL